MYCWGRFNEHGYKLRYRRLIARFSYAHDSKLLARRPLNRGHDAQNAVGYNCDSVRLSIFNCDCKPRPPLRPHPFPIRTIRTIKNGELRTATSTFTQLLSSENHSELLEFIDDHRLGRLKWLCKRKSLRAVRVYNRRLGQRKIMAL